MQNSVRGVFIPVPNGPDKPTGCQRFPVLTSPGTLGANPAASLSVEPPPPDPVTQRACALIWTEAKHKTKAGQRFLTLLGVTSEANAIEDVVVEEVRRSAPVRAKRRGISCAARRRSKPAGAWRAVSRQVSTSGGIAERCRRTWWPGVAKPYNYYAEGDIQDCAVKSPSSLCYETSRTPDAHPAV